MNTKDIFEQLIRKEDLTPETMHLFINDCMQGKLSDLEIAVFLSLMRMKGETVTELTTAAKTMMDFFCPIDLGDNIVDIVGTGGSGKNIFNVSTVSSFVAAAAGALVAKHGNCALSSVSGSADFLLASGFQITGNRDILKNCLDQSGLCFLFAPYFHPTMHIVQAARKQLGIRSLFNILGPLLNPACPKRQVVGVSSFALLKPIANVLVNLGRERLLVLHAQEGLDEISIASSTDVIEYYRGEFKQWVIHPADYGFIYDSLEEITITSPDQSVRLAKSVLSGERGAARDIVLLNAAAVLYCVGITTHFEEAIEKAKEAIDSQEASRRFYNLRKLTQHHE